MSEIEKKRRGFAIMKEQDPERLRQICKKGGANTPNDKRSFSTNHQLAVAAGTKGGKASRGGGRPKVHP